MSKRKLKDWAIIGHQNISKSNKIGITKTVSIKVDNNMANLPSDYIDSIRIGGSYNRGIVKL